MSLYLVVMLLYSVINSLYLVLIPLCSSINSIFLPAWCDIIVIASSTRPIVRFFTLRCIRVRYLLFSLFQIGQHFLWSMFTHTLTELHLLVIRKMIGLTMLINWVASQFVVSTKVAVVNCIDIIGLSIKRELLLLAIMWNLHFSTNIRVFFQLFFRNWTWHGY